MSSERLYYYFLDDEQKGPVNLSELIKIISPDTLIWHEGLQEWTVAKEIEEFRNIFKIPIRELTNVKSVEVNEDVENEKHVEIVNGAILDKPGKPTDGGQYTSHQDSKYIQNQNDLHPSTPNNIKKYIYLLLSATAIIITSIFILKYFRSTSQSPIESKIYANIKKNNKIRIGYISANVLDSDLQSCLTRVFGDRIIKLYEVKSIDQLIEKCRQEEIDIVFINAEEKKKMSSILDYSDGFKIEKRELNHYFGFPLGNENHIKKFNNCKDSN